MAFQEDDQVYRKTPVRAKIHTKYDRELHLERVYFLTLSYVEVPFGVPPNGLYQTKV